MAEKQLKSMLKISALQKNPKTSVSGLNRRLKQTVAYSYFLVDAGDEWQAKV
ncbi:MAG: hypothetical protein ACFCUE_09745 [Candidatus Bathyarchaeia archaeon]